GTALVCAGAVPCRGAARAAAGWRVRGVGLRRLPGGAGDRSPQGPRLRRPGRTVLACRARARRRRLPHAAVSVPADRGAAVRDDDAVERAPVPRLPALVVGDATL